jgi:hypothetical protein
MCCSKTQITHECLRVALGVLDIMFSNSGQRNSVEMYEDEAAGARL